MANGTFYVLTVAASSCEHKRIVAATDSEGRAELLKRIVPNAEIKETTDLTAETIGPSPFWLVTRYVAGADYSFKAAPFEHDRDVEFGTVLPHFSGGEEIVLQAPNGIKAIKRSFDFFEAYDRSKERLKRGENNG